MMDMLFRDITVAFRAGRASRGPSIAALLSIALGVGGTTAMFSVVYGVLMRPLPYPESQQLVGVWEVHPGANAPIRGDLISRPVYRAWAETSTTIESIASYRTGDFIVADSSATKRVRGARVTPSLFTVLRATPGHGRFLLPNDAVDAAAPVVVIGDTFWRNHFARDSSAVGRTLVLDDVDHTVVGIAPPHFAFPDPEIDLYLPQSVPRVDPANQAIAVMTAIARLRPGVTEVQAEAEGTAIARSVRRPFADIVFGSGAPVEVRVRRAVDQETRDIKGALLVLAAGIGLLMLIACANVANLLVTKASDRIREFAVRAALGATGGQLLRQLAIESVLVAMAGGVLGLFLAWLLTSAIPSLAPATVPRLHEIRIDARFFAAAFFASALIGVIAGVWPALLTSRVDLTATLQSGGSRSVASSGRTLRRSLVVAEAALAVVLLVAAALLGRSYVTLVQVDAGYEPENVLAADLVLPRDFKPHQTAQLAMTLADRLQSAPGVRAAAIGSMAPFGGALYSSGFALPGLTGPDGQPLVARALQAVVTPGYAEALGIRLKEGRFLSRADYSTAAIAMVINDTFARTYFTDGRQVAGRVFSGMFPNMLKRNDAVVTVVGVVEDVLHDRLDGRPQPQIYLPTGLGFERLSSTIVVRTTGNPAAAAPIVRRAVEELEPTARVERIAPLTTKRFDSLREPRFTALVLGLFAALAVGLAMTGLYGVLAHNVSQRRRELAVRGALGATQKNLLTMILVEGLSLVSIGIVLGAGAAMAITRSLASLLFGVQPLDPLAFALAALSLLATAAAAAGVPARRAARVEPAEALKAS